MNNIERYDDTIKYAIIDCRVIIPMLALQSP